MGALVTLPPAPDSPIREAPWIVRFEPLAQDEGWEPVVCGPYEQPHAIALAEEVVADQDLMAVVEPVLGAASVPEIRGQIDGARDAAEQSRIDVVDDGEDFDLDDEVSAAAPQQATVDPDDLAFEGIDAPASAPRHAALPSPAEVRAGMARVAHRLADAD